MKIRYIGKSQVRVIGEYRWDANNEFIQDVDTELAADLLTYPRPEFEAVEEEDVEEVISFVKGEEPRAKRKTRQINQNFFLPSMAISLPTKNRPRLLMSGSRH